MGYDPKEIEAKWQRLWAEEKTWEVANPGQPGHDPEKPKYYVLEMLPYPSGQPHVGHAQVLHGRRRDRALPPQARLSTCCTRWASTPSACRPRTPRSRAACTRATGPSANIERMQRPVPRSGRSRIDWDARSATATPDYYRWNQWLFLQLYREGARLSQARRRSTGAPRCQTVLANEQVVDGRCERCGDGRRAARARAVVLPITDYAEGLLADLEHARLARARQDDAAQLDRPHRGRRGRLRARRPSAGSTIPVFTTRPDTLFGVTFMVLAPEHPLVERAHRRHAPRGRRCASTSTRCRARGRAIARAEDREKTGVPLGALRDQPGQRRGVPIWIANFVLMELRHRRDHGRPRARPARLRVRARPFGSRSRS